MNEGESRMLNSSAKPWIPASQNTQPYQDPNNYDSPAGQMPYEQQQPPYNHPSPYAGRGRQRQMQPGYNSGGAGFNNNHAAQQGNYYGGQQRQDPMYPQHRVPGGGAPGGYAPRPGNANMNMGVGNAPNYDGGVPHMRSMQAPRGRPPAGANSGTYGGNNRDNNMGMQQQYGGTLPPPPQMPSYPQQGPYGAQPHQQQQRPIPNYNQQQNMHQMGGMPMNQMGGNVPSYQAPPPPARTHMPLPPNHQQQQRIRSPMASGVPSPHPAQQQQQPQPHQQHQQQQQLQQQQAAVPTYLHNPVPKVVMVTGYSRTGKTTVAKAIAKERGYEYISLAPATKSRDGNRKEEMGDEEEEDEDEEYHSLADRFAPLSELLARKSSLKGIVIDDALIYNKFEPYYVVFMLQKAGLHLDYLVLITTELSTLLERGVVFDTNKKKKAHPESFEFGVLLENHNSANGASTPIAVVDGECELELVVKESLKELKDVEERGLPPLELPQVNFIPNCSLVSDPQLVDQVLAAERAALGVSRLEYGFPYAEPNFLMEYVQFARHALLFKQYQIVPWIWGDKVSIIGCDDEVYVHLPSYKVVFHLSDVSPPLRELMGQLKNEIEAKKAEEPAADDDDKPRSTSPAAAQGDKVCLFSVEATMLKSVLYISDMMVLGTHMGSRMLLPDRVALMKERLGKLPATGPVRLLEHYHVRDIQKCLKAYADVARGVLFVNPDGMAAGLYESRNFIYPSEDVKSVKIRIWGGRVDSEGLWTFDALASDSGKDTPIIKEDGSTALVYISDEDVCQFSVNDGDIVECIEVQSNGMPSPQKGGKKGAKSQTTSTHLAFQHRCDWQVDPTTLYYQSAFLSKPSWATNMFLEACSSIRYEAPVAATKNN